MFSVLRDATEGMSVTVPVDIPNLGLRAGEVPLQQFLIDNVLFAWAPTDASITRIQWALADMFLTGDQIYISAEKVRALAETHSLDIEDLVSGPSGHLAIAVRT